MDNKPPRGFMRNEEKSSPSTGDSPPDDPAPESAHSQPTKTPLFKANHAERYLRQTLIHEIQEQTGHRLLCYVGGSHCPITEKDTRPFVDLLHNVPTGQNVDLLLHTVGGTIDAAEKLIRMVRGRVDSATLRIIVPEFAKSAGTLMVLGADRVVMSDMSELGPIDPQIQLFDQWQSVQNYLDAYETHYEALSDEPGNVGAQVLLGKLDPVAYKLCEAAKNRARQSAETVLRNGMFRDNDGNWSRTVEELLDTKRWLSHAQMISWEDARDLGLTVHYLDYWTDEWQAFWELYCHQSLAIGDRQKLYESDYVSQVVGAST